jgi:hypothetical protein
VIVSFKEYTPVPRFDGVPWTIITVEESPGKVGPWTLIESIAVDPVDADPQHPQPRSFTTNGATLEDGWYRVSFLDVNGNTLVIDPPIHNIPPDGIQYLPSLSEVGKVNLGRTYNDVGIKTGTFTETTNPTAEQVQSIIRDAADDVRRQIGTVIPDDLVDDARRVVAVRAAMIIELSLFASEVATQRSPYQQIRDMYKELISSLQSAVAAEEAGEDPRSEMGDSGGAQFSFPAPAGFLTREM